MLWVSLLRVRNRTRRQSVFKSGVKGPRGESLRVWDV